MRANGVVFGLILVLVCGAVREALSDAGVGTVLANGGFESVNEDGTMAEGWGLYTSGGAGCVLSTEVKRSGAQSVEMKTGGARNAHKCIYQVVPVEPKERYEFSVHAMNHASEPLDGSARGTLVIEWWDKDEKEISRVESTKWGQGLSAKAWSKFTVKDKAPVNAASGHFVIYLCDGPSNGSGSFFVDDAEVLRK